MVDRHLRRSVVVLGAFVGMLSLAAPAAAHTGHGMSGALSGLVHPLLGIDHLLAMVTVGFLAHVVGRGMAFPAAFVGAMTLGGAAGVAGLTLPLGELAVAVSVAALGATLVAGAAARPRPALVLVALAGLAHGHAHGLEAPQSANPASYIVGFILATSLLHAVGWTVGSTTRHHPVVRTTAGAGVLGAGLGLAIGII